MNHNNLITVGIEIQYITKREEWSGYSWPYVCPCTLQFTVIPTLLFPKLMTTF